MLAIWFPMRRRRSIELAANSEERRLWATMTRRDVEDLSTLLSPLTEEFRRSCFAVMHAGLPVGGRKIYSVDEVYVRYPHFRVTLLPRNESVAMHIEGFPPATYLADRREMVRRHLFAMLRDYRSIAHGVPPVGGATTARVCAMHTDAGVLDGNEVPRHRVIVLGGHKISAAEEHYARAIGAGCAQYDVELINGAGPGIMDETFRGSTETFRESGVADARCIGCTAKDIMLDESVNGYNNPLVTFPTMPMRHEGYLRPADSLCVLPGGVGTANEILRFLAFVLHPKNARVTFPITFVGPPSSRGYYQAIDAFLVSVFGREVRERYEIVSEEPAAVVPVIADRAKHSRRKREGQGRVGSLADVYHFPPELQEPFCMNHATISALNLHRAGQTQFQLAISIANAFDAITFGDVTYAGREMVRSHGPFLIHGDSDIGEEFEKLLQRFVAEGRLRGRGEGGQCYQLVM